MGKINTSLAGKVAVVTGASSGIGRAAARAFAAHGANLSIAARRKERLEEVAGDAEAFGVEALTIVADVGVEEDLKKIHEQTMAKYGGIDILLNNAGMIEMCMLEDLTYESFERVLRINTWSGIRLAQLCRPALREAEDGIIVNIASDDVLYPSPGIGAYSMSKICQMHFTRHMATEWGPDRIRVVAISPSVTRTEIIEEWVEEFEAAMDDENFRFNPMRRICEPEEIAAAIVFVSSPAGAFINGTNHVIDGGMSAMVPIDL
ncbi:MAG: glucose 1-dehydrogenase [Rhodospirillaceae bacterium]|nr:glucose 1-dehydrogenase [Rhodospirillaceae bacterium]